MEYISEYLPLFYSNYTNDILFIVLENISFMIVAIYSLYYIDRHITANHDLYKSILNKKNDLQFPPSILIDALIPPERAIDMQANLAETFPLWVERHGLAAAHYIRKVQIARLIIGEYGNKVLELIKAIKLAGS